MSIRDKVPKFSRCSRVSQDSGGATKVLECPARKSVLTSKRFYFAALAIYIVGVILGSLWAAGAL